jgi:hypothetical protein
MSSSDYTTLKKLNYLNNCTSNVQNTCYTYQNPPSYTYQNPPSCSSYYISCAADTGCSNNTTCNTVATSTCNTVDISTCNTVATATCKQDTFSTTTEDVLITPIINGAVTFTVCKNLSFTLGLPVTVSSSSNLNNYFEGFIYDYDKCSGNVTVNKIQYMSGIFTSPSNYLINVTNNITELNSLRNQITELYALLDNSDNALLTQQSLDVIELYYYFFAEDIRLDCDYEVTEIYLNTKMNYLYTYFFGIDITLSSNFGWNLNNTSVQLNTLTNKISQMYIYFFGTYTSSFTIVTM